MHPACLAGREADSCAGSVARQAGGDRRGAPERTEGVAVLDEHLRAGGFGAAVADVVDVAGQPASASGWAASAAARAFSTPAGRSSPGGITTRVTPNESNAVHGSAS